MVQKINKTQLVTGEGVCSLPNPKHVEALTFWWPNGPNNDKFQRNLDIFFWGFRGSESKKLIFETWGLFSKMHKNVKFTTSYWTCTVLYKNEQSETESLKI